MLLSRMRSRGTLALLAALLAPAALHAQRDRYAPIVLQVPAGVRATGLGSAVTTSRDVEAVFWNPALAGLATGTAVSFGQFNGEARIGSLAASLTAGSVNTAIGVQVLDHDVAAVRLPVSSGLLTHAATGAGESLVGTFALATSFRAYRVGAAVKYVEERLSAVRDGEPSLDLGVARNVGSIAWGLAVQNIGPDIEYPTTSARQPLRATLGASMPTRAVGPLDFGLAAGVSVLRDGFVAPAAGMEWGYVPLDGYNVVVRAGVRRPELEEQRPLSLGASFTLDRFTLDYSYESFHTGGGHRIGIRVR